MLSEMELVSRLLIAAFLGALIGLERERKNGLAGLRTHLLVSTGAALLIIIGINLGEPARIAGHVVSGIGFLGAGNIIRSRATVRGLTTAASLWLVAGIGLAAGSGYYVSAALTTVIALIALHFLPKLK